MKTALLIKDTHRGLRYADGIMKEVLGPGFYEIPRRWNLPFYRTPLIEIVLVDVRERDLTIKGQEILTADNASASSCSSRSPTRSPRCIRLATTTNASTAMCSLPPAVRSRR